ncbi:LysR family transcriptional regulator [Pseudorhodoferax sp.]|uniref:LysR family transcriptional regulator n=1 Tax=Pseudorhodoferax sp. TaxID=1993553 RepID=UPI002DD67596|nr:LysR substrate-binding domain-containing protein [Pseudorhodoferax sp.]
MDRLARYRVFLQVAEMGSFIKAAHALELPRASVSAAVQQLEAALGTRLLHRTTRRVHLTADGEQLTTRVRALLAEAEDIEHLFQLSQRQVAGRLKVDVPSRIARRLVAPALPVLLRRHPRLQIVLGSTDRSIDLVREGVDIAVRVGTLPSSSLVVRPLGHIVLINCASAGYLREHGLPQSGDDLLARHQMVGYASPTTGRETPWEHGPTALAMHSRVVVNSAESYIAACRAGLGLIQIPRYDVQHLLDRGELVEVLPTHRAAPMPLSLLYPHRRPRPRRLEVFIDWFAALMAPQLEGA